MAKQQFTPKLFTLLRDGISRDQLVRDLLSGLIVGIVALPLAIAFAIASGVSPDKGLITAIVAGFIISAFGGSRVQIGGPTGAFIVIVYAIVQEHGVGGLTIATFLAGFIIIAMGLMRLGSLLRYIPYPLIVGFTSGIAVIIFSSQMKDFFGLPIENVPAEFLDKWILFAKHADSINWISAAIATATVIVSLTFGRITSKIPGSIVAILATTAAVQFFALPVDTIETVFGEIPNKISMPSMPEINFEIVQDLMGPALAIALLGSIESLLSAVVADGMIGGRHRSNMELIAQGTANVFSALFGGIPATGAIARTATNIKNGGRTPISGMAHAAVLLLIMLVLAPYAKLIPMAALAGILVVVAYHMSEWRQFLSLARGNKMDVLVLLVTFFLTVIFDLVIAIEVGIVLSSLLFMKRMAGSMTILNVEGQAGENGEQLFEEELPEVPKGVVLYEIKGALFFGAAQHFQDTLTDLRENPRVLVLRMRNVPFIDATGTYRLKEILHRFKKRKTHIILSGVNAQVMAELEKAGIPALIGKENLPGNISASISRAGEILGEKG